MRFCLISFLSVAVSQHVEVFPEERVSLVEMTTVERREKRVEAVVDDAEMKQVLREKQVVLPQAEREIEDDWYVLLDVPTRKSSFVPPGIDTQSLQAYFVIFGVSVLQYLFLLFDISYHGQVCSGLS